MLSRKAREFAEEIKNHDWSDAPYRADRAGHDRKLDHTSVPQLSKQETAILKLNVVWVVAQVLMHEDPNLQIDEFAIACGLPRTITHRQDGEIDGGLDAGIRRDPGNGRIASPGSWEREV